MALLNVTGRGKDITLWLTNQPINKPAAGHSASLMQSPTTLLNSLDLCICGKMCRKPPCCRYKREVLLSIKHLWAHTLNTLTYPTFYHLAQHPYLPNTLPVGPYTFSYPACHPPWANERIAPLASEQGGAMIGHCSNEWHLLLFLSKYFIIVVGLFFFFFDV